jgi:hypothetical protein
LADEKRDHPTGLLGGGWDLSILKMTLKISYKFVKNPNPEAMKWTKNKK